MKWLIPYAGETFTFDDERLSASEARLQKRITVGMAPFVAERAREQMDPDAWVAALVIGRLRSGLDAIAAADIDADEVDLMAAMKLTREAGQAEVRDLRAAAKAAPDAPADVEAPAAPEAAAS
ncbi:hypothetical protein [Pseudonocardia broussonetiae]|uniref:Uncharacterized protein n=1 Tax=Pseudonocardia broussonetiae TaxID=2736640 RepID=A0A6M6JJ39_9PSEU|nr:hypothetical protein [Pseudonocardia broussonetiae]QJY46652.1 hypothetical protein HOP40_13185 [Pseudonocardia broussonetiae]